ncbi:nucleoside 2-deoxyribosyltransferase [Flavobacterium sp. CHNK8]|uniref:nucleoside 2-deoxyribosyltransferase n=1 Tax=Flavobacterium sp. CHNK8 TaxID=2871165 RepID=UPI001C8D2501|nr:nucleoside 2-deoxyribosyltransferase [Flavobacterium sp. CHNK8]QZK89859.1 nucleoside 2-deoxyribosyltransferase [Flavobacterium sp. CHNK8]
MENWLVTVGNAKFEDGKIIYIPQKGKREDGTEFNYISIVSSNIEFENGKINFSVQTKDKLALAQLVLSSEKGGSINIGMNTMGVLFGVTKYDKDNQRYENPEGAGFYETYIPENIYNYTVEVNGSVITLFVNGIKITESIQDVKRGQIKFYLSGESEIVISNMQVNTMKPKAFIVMQFTEEYNQLYKEVIKPVCENFGLEVERADEFYTTTPIIADVIRSIVNSSLIIAEITPDNANVYYEVGYAHAINKPTILLCERKKREKLPFDISGFRTLFYEDSISGKSTVEKNLKKFLENINM